MNVNLISFLIRLFHIFVILFIVLTPFISDYFLILLLHFVSSLSLIVHWYTNNNICSLTLLEASLTGAPINNGFIYGFISPVYDFLQWNFISENNLNIIIYTIVIVLGSISLYKMWKILTSSSLPEVR